MSESERRPPRGRLPAKEPEPFKVQLRQNLVSASVIALSGIALISLLAGILFATPAAAVVYLALVEFRLPMILVIVVGAFFDKSRWWLGGATLAYLSCFLAPVFLGVLMRLQQVAGRG